MRCYRWENGLSDPIILWLMLAAHSAHPVVIPEPIVVGLEDVQRKLLADIVAEVLHHHDTLTVIDAKIVILGECVLELRIQRNPAVALQIEITTHT